MGGAIGTHRNWWRVLAVALALIAIAGIWQPAISSAASATTVTIAGNTPSAGNCVPFGTGGVSGSAAWAPFAAFVYKNIPAFQLKPNDTLAFDTNALNDANINLDIALARTTTNGGDAPAQPFTKVVNNTQTPANPRGDTTAGNFDLAFNAQAPFSFPGGGLIIRFSNPSAAYAADSTCTVNLVGANAPDTSNFFVERAFHDIDGTSPWDFTDGASIGAFQLTIAPKPTNVFSLGGVHRHKHAGTATLVVSVPGPGTVDLKGNGVKPQQAGGGALAVVGAGTVNLLVKAKGPKKHKLNKKGKVKVKVNVTFTPTYGDPKTQTKSVKLIEKK